jgi:PPOX class probable F420-dependent enzyme
VPRTAELTPGLQQFLKGPVRGEIATLMPDGSPQVTLVWLDTDGTHIVVNSVTTHQKTRNVRRDPRVAINVHDDTARRLAHIRGRVVEMKLEGADEHIDQLARKYLGTDTYPWRRPGEQRIILKIQPVSVYSMGFEGGTAWPLPDRGQS